MPSPRLKEMLLVVVALVTAVVCVRLGLWQLDRLEQRRVLNRLHEQRLASSPVQLSGAASFDTLEYRRARAVGTFDEDREIVVVTRRLGGLLGVHVITPLRLDDSTAVLVNRGWVSAPDGRSVDLAALAEPGRVSVPGYVVPPRASRPHNFAGQIEWPLHVGAISVEQVESLYPYRLLPIILMRDRASVREGSGFTALSLPDFQDGPHLSYAIQWFSFAVIALVGTAFLLRADRRNLAES